MDLVLDLMQGAGVAAAVGIRPCLPALATGALAAGDVGVNFDGTDFSFLEKWGFLLALVVLAALLDFGARRVGQDRMERQPFLPGLLLISVGLGALLAAGSVADHSNDWWAGIIVGVPVAALGFFSSRQLFGRVRRRLDTEAAAALPVYAEAVAIISAIVSVLLPPVGVVIVLALAWLLLGNRRRSGQKYAGLRILR